MWKRLSRILYICFAVLTALALIKSLNAGQVVLDFPDVDITILNDRWESGFVQQDQQRLACLSYIIEQDTSDNLILSIKGLPQAFLVYLNNTLVYSFQDPLKERGVARHWINFPPHIAGQELRIQAVSEEDSLQSLETSTTYLGRQNAILLYFLRDNTYALLFGGITLLLGALSISVNIYLRRNRLLEPLKGIGCLGIFILDAGLWILTDSEILQLFTNNTAAIWLASFLSFIMMPVPLLLFLKNVFRRESRIWLILCCLYTASAILCLSVYLLKAAPLSRVLILTHILIPVTILFVLWQCIYELRAYGDSELKTILAGFGLLSLFGIGALVSFYRDVSGNYSYLYCIGIILFILCLLQVALLRLGYYLKRNADVEAYQKLAHMDALTQLNNRASFIAHQEQAQCQSQLAYLILDVNNLKLVNDQYGHREGDQLIIDAATCIHETFSSVGQCFRIGGDEFAVVLKELDASAIEGLLGRLKQPIQTTNTRRTLPLSIAVGYALRTDSSKTIQMLYEEADANMYAQKKRMKEPTKHPREGE